MILPIGFALSLPLCILSCPLGSSVPQSLLPLLDPSSVVLNIFSHVTHLQCVAWQHRSFGSYVMVSSRHRQNFQVAKHSHFFKAKSPPLEHIFISENMVQLRAQS